MRNKPFDVIVWGASGFTGRLVVEYLLQQYGTGGDLTWAIAGRNQDKLGQVLADLGNESIPIFLADSMDAASLHILAKQTRVICTTVGPYAKYGSALVEACVENGTDYCDLTGEVQWIRRMIDQHHEAARRKKVRIVHCCGFDSIPSDMGVYYLQEKARETRGEYCEQVKMRVRGMRGGFSGGTVASARNVLVEAKQDPSIFRTLQSPYGLNPLGEQTGADQPDLEGIEYDEDFEGWISPFVMAAINSKVVRRSHALNDYPYGPGFRYDEAMFNGPGRKGRFSASIMSRVIRLVTDSRPDSFLGRMLDRFSPKPGAGPSAKQRQGGFFNLVFLGKWAGGGSLRVKVTGDRDPGYGSTSKMLGESAVCLALDREKLPDNYGIITPSVAMGDLLLERLQENAGLSFSVQSKY